MAGRSHQFGHNINILFSCPMSDFQFSLEVSSYIQALSTWTIQRELGWQESPMLICRVVVTRMQDAEL